MNSNEPQNAVRGQRSRQALLVAIAMAASACVSWPIASAYLGHDHIAAALVVQISMIGALALVSGAVASRGGAGACVGLVLGNLLLYVVYRGGDHRLTWKLGWTAILVLVPLACYSLGWIIRASRRDRDRLAVGDDGEVRQDRG